MKKKNIKGLKLYKSSISNFESVSGAGPSHYACNTGNLCYSRYDKCSVLYCISNSPIYPACLETDQGKRLLYE